MATALLIGGGVLTAPAAHAENHGTMPKGCSISPITPKLDAKKRVAYSGSGYCKAIPINNFVAILVHNYDGLPDARVKISYSSLKERPDYYANGATCDNGGTTQYFTEAGYWRSQPYTDVIRTSSQKTLTHC